MRKQGYCRHILTNGRRCKAPPLVKNIWCYFHDRSPDRIAKRHQPARPTSQEFVLPTLDSPKAIHTSISLILNAVTQRTLAPTRANSILTQIEQALGALQKNPESGCPISGSFTARCGGIPTSTEHPK